TQSVEQIVALSFSYNAALDGCTDFIFQETKCNFAVVVGFAERIKNSIGCCFIVKSFSVGHCGICSNKTLSRLTGAGVLVPSLLPSLALRLVVIGISLVNIFQEC